MDLTQATAPAMTGSILLAALVLLPALGAILLAFIPKEQTAAHRGLGATIALLVFALSILLITGFDPSVSGFQPGTSIDVDWITGFGARLSLGVDGISLWIAILTTFLTPLALIGSQTGITKRVREFVISMLLLESAMLGALFATDMLLFYLFWEMMLIPMYLLIGIWGGENRLYATMKFVVYTVVGSLLMLVAVIYLYLKTGETGAPSFAFERMLSLELSATEQGWLFAAFALAFVIKVPLFPFHTWLPDAHTEAPMAGSVILAGILLKMGTYGLLRFAVPLFPEAMGSFSPVILIFSVIGIVYGALVAFAQGDWKKLVAYSSVSHLGFVMLGIVSFTQQSVEGSILQMINHGVSTGALFMLIGMVYERTHTRKITDYGGIAKSMPVFTALFIIVTMSSIGLPGTNGFTGEFMILSGAFLDSLFVPAGAAITDWPMLATIMSAIAVTGVLLGAIYMLSVVRRVFFGPMTNPDNAHLKDLTTRERLVMAPLIAFIFIIGFFPTTFTSQTTASVEQLMTMRPRIELVRDKTRQKELRGPRTGMAPSVDTRADAARVALSVPSEEE